LDVGGHLGRPRAPEEAREERHAEEREEDVRPEGARLLALLLGRGARHRGFGGIDRGRDLGRARRVGVQIEIGYPYQGSSSSSMIRVIFSMSSGSRTSRKPPTLPFRALNESGSLGSPGWRRRVS